MGQAPRRSSARRSARPPTGCSGGGQGCRHLKAWRGGLSATRTYVVDGRVCFLRVWSGDSVPQQLKVAFSFLLCGSCRREAHGVEAGSLQREQVRAWRRYARWETHASYNLVLDVTPLDFYCSVLIKGNLQGPTHTLGEGIIQGW